MKAHDKAGNVCVSAGVTVTVDNTAPVTAVSAPAQGALVRGTVPVSATASDAGGVERVEFYAGTTLLGTSTTAPYVVSWNTAAGAQGSITLTTKAYDAVGNVAVSAGRTGTVDNVAPTVAITSPANGTSFSFLTFSTTIQASASAHLRQGELTPRTRTPAPRAASSRRHCLPLAHEAALTLFERPRYNERVSASDS